MRHFNYKKNLNKNFTNLFDILYKESKKAFKLGEVPVAALIYDPINKFVISKAHNLNRKKFNPCGHAEVEAIIKACKILKKSRLDNYDLFCTLEPCLMCSSIIFHSKIRRVYFSIEEKKMGAMVNNFKLGLNSKFNCKTKIYYGFDEERFSKLLKDFFKGKR
ncbi:MAG: nucleoside deaminase [Pelagibacteraceae bacterium]|nr:nucleoside deaminase [Pelagibacteraceae bacterium]